MQTIFGGGNVRIALIADIHGNGVALDAVLTSIEREGIDRIVCLGDVAATGPQPRQVIARLRDLDCPVVMGNADAFLLNPSSAPESIGGEAGMLLDIDLWASGQLAAEDREFLGSFQATTEVPLDGGATLLCFHGSPRSITEGILPTTSDRALADMLAGYGQPLLAAGHTHQAMVRRFRQSILVNPGSVGLPFDRVPPDQQTRNPTWAEYAVITWTSDQSAVELRRVRYSLDALLRAIRESGMPHAEQFAAGWIQA